MSLHDDLLLTVAIGKRNMGRGETKTVPWSRLRGMLVDVYRTKETVVAYHAMSQVERGAIKGKRGWWIAADLPEGSRRRSTVGSRSCIVFDIDDATRNQYTLFRGGKNPVSQYEFCAHQTHSHTPAKPRWRVVFPLARPIPNAHYEAACRILARAVDPTMGMVDHVSFRKIQMMFRPTYALDGEADPWHNEGRLLDAKRDLLDPFDGDWEDHSQLPRRPNELATRETAEKAQDPTTKTGIVGAFCRTYDVEQAIDAFIPHIYGDRTEHGDKPRYTYLLGTGANAAEVQDEGLFIYSHHGSDPISETLCNSFDMVRVHLFGELDEGRETVDEGGERLSPSKWPSYQAMVEMLDDDADVMNNLMESVSEDFDEDDVAEGEDEPVVQPAPRPTPRAAPVVQRAPSRIVDPEIEELIGEAPEVDLIGEAPAPAPEPVPAAPDMDDDIAELVGRASDKPAPVDRSKLTPLMRINLDHAVVAIGGSTKIMNVEPEGGVSFSNLSDFSARYMNQEVPKKGTKDTMPVPEYWLKHPRRRQYLAGVTFDPRAPLSKPTDTGYKSYNLWRGWTVPASDDASGAGCQLFLDHCRDVVCNGDETAYRYLLGWMAHIVQYPGQKPGVAVVLRGRKGVGKDTVGDYLGRLCVQNHVKISQMGQLTGQFNAHMEKALILHVEEAIWAGDKAKHGPLQNAITSEFMSIERKGVDIVQRPNFMRLIISSNEDWVVPATEDERRYFVLNVPETRREDHVYFDALRAERDGDGPSALLAYLQTYDLTGFQVRDVPKTVGLTGQIVEGLKGFERFVFEILDTDESSPPETHPDFFDVDWRTEFVPVTKQGLFAAYEDWLAKRRGRLGDGAPLNNVHFGRRLIELLHARASQRGRERSPVYVLPSLPECRAHFEAKIGLGVPWTPMGSDIDDLV